jgi:hypothetical protein
MNSLSLSLQRLHLLYPLLFIVYELAFYILVEAPFTLSPAIHCLRTRFLYPCRGSLYSIPCYSLSMNSLSISLQRLPLLYPLLFIVYELAFYIHAKAPFALPLLFIVYELAFYPCRGSYRSIPAIHPQSSLSISLQRLPFRI